MKLALDDAGHVIVEDGKPVYEHADGKRAAFDAAHTVATITRLNGESKAQREAREAAEGRLKGYEGIEDAEAARKAMETVRNLGAGELKTAAQVAEIQEAARKAAEEQVRAAAESNGRRIKELQGLVEKSQHELYAEKVGGAFSRSKFVTDKVAIPPDLLQARFGQQFKVEDGKTVGYDSAGNKIYSRAKPGEIADFDEAMEMMIDSYPYRDSILKGSGSTGAGARPTNGGGNGGAGKTMTKAAFDALAPMQQAQLMSSAERPTIVE